MITTTTNYEEKYDCQYSMNEHQSTFNETILDLLTITNDVKARILQLKQIKYVHG